MKVNTVRVGMAVVVAPEGRLDVAGAEVLDREIDQLFSHDPNLNYLVIDLGKIGFISSQGIRVLLKHMKRIFVSGGETRIVKPREEIFEVFTLSGLEKVFDFHYSLQAALKDWPSMARPSSASTPKP